jgi:predicted transport protein
MKKVGESVVFASSNEKEAYSEYIGKLVEGQVVEVEIKNSRSKTLPQLAFYHAAILPACLRGLKDCGYKSLHDIEVSFNVKKEIDTEDCDRLLKEMYRTSRTLEDKPLKRNMSLEDMQAFIDYALDFLAMELNTFLEVEH